MKSRRGKLSHNQDAALPNAKGMPGVDQYYELYRLGLIMASAPGQARIPTKSAFADEPTFVPYSPEDERILELARKMAGFGPFRELSHGSSREDLTVNKVSPVNQNVHKKPDDH